MLKKFIFILFCSLFFSLVFGESGTKLKVKQYSKLRVAVLDFNSAGIDAGMAATATETMITEIVNTNYFKVIERSQMKKILNEQGFQMSGAVEMSQAVEAGKLLSAHSVLMGTISKVGESFLINARIVDIEKGETLTAEKSMVKTPEEMILTCESVAKKLIEKMKTRAEQLKMDAVWSVIYRQKPINDFISAKEINELGSVAGFAVSSAPVVVKEGDFAELKNRTNKNLLLVIKVNYTIPENINGIEISNSTVEAELIYLPENTIVFSEKGEGKGALFNSEEVVKEGLRKAWKNLIEKLKNQK